MSQSSSNDCQCPEQVTATNSPPSEIDEICTDDAMLTSCSNINDASQGADATEPGSSELSTPENAAVLVGTDSGKQQDSIVQDNTGAQHVSQFERVFACHLPALDELFANLSLKDIQTLWIVSKECRRIFSDGKTVRRFLRVSNCMSVCEF